MSYILHYTPNVAWLQEMWVIFSLECLVGLPYRVVVSTPFCGGGPVILFHLSRCGGGGPHLDIHTCVGCVCSQGHLDQHCCGVHPISPRPHPGPRRDVYTAAARFLRGSRAVLQVSQRDLNAFVRPRGGWWLSKELKVGAWQFLSCPYDDRSPSNFVRMRRAGGGWHLSETLTD